jgi:lysozyme
LPILQRSRLALIAAGLALSVATPAHAADPSQSWVLTLPQASQPHQVAYLPPLPAAPRVFGMTAERRAMLNTIRYAEGTWAIRCCSVAPSPPASIATPTG